MEFDPSQQAVLDRVAAGDHGPLLVTGGPGTGKSSLAVELVLRFLRAGGDSHHLLLLSPSRASSAALRDAVEARWATEPDGGSLTDQPSRSFASYAFWLLGEARRRGFLEFDARMPRLLSGAEQDREIAALLESEHTAIDWRVADPRTGTVRIDLREAAATAGFRKEIRELFDRAAEYGVGPEELVGWGEQAASGAGPGEPAWAPAGRLYGEYLEQLGQRAPNAFDPSGLISRACDLLEDAPPLLHEEQDRLRLILVDDLQEANPNIFRLLRLIGAGRRVVACANPDVAVQGFRGARPDLLAHWSGQTGDRPSAALDDRSVRAAEREAPDDAGVTLRGRRGSMRPGEGLPGSEPEVLSLEGDHRLSEGVGEVYGRVVQRIGAVGDTSGHRQRWARLATTAQQRLDELAAAHRAESERRAATGEKSASGRRLNVAADVDTGGRGVHVAVVGGHYHAEQMILQEVLERHHRGGEDGEPLPLDEIAVVVRNGATVQQLTRLFHSHGVPVRRSMSEIVLHEEVAVASLLRILRAVTADDPLTGADARRLLAGPYGAVDSVALRRIRQRLLSAERRLRPETVDQRGSEELLAVGVSDPIDPTVAAALESKDPALTGLRRLAAMVAAARETFARLGEAAGAGDLLWEAWQASGNETLWVRRSARGGEEARRAHRDLDAVVSLFQAAERYAEQLPGHSVGGFVTHMEEMELPMDTLAEASTAQDAVHVLTPATAAGKEFDTVVLAGLQDGVWPNLTPRGALLGSSRLVDVVDGADPAADGSSRAKRLQVLQDEHRLFAAAVSRAKHRLVGIGIENTDETPSMLLDLILPPLLRPSSELARPRAMTAPTLIAEMRRRLEHHHSSVDSGTSEHQAQEAARALAVLAAAEDPHSGDRIPGADPEQWWGTDDPREVRPLITEQELDDGAEIRLSPSALDTAFNQPLQWFTQRAGGVAPTDQARSLGVLIHSIAEDHPQPRARPHETQRMLLEALAARWPELGMDPDSWRTRGEYARAQEMVKKITWYLHAAEEADRRHVISEAHFTTGSRLPVRGAMRDVTVSGLIDRIEEEVDDAGAPTGRFFILDYKTGRHAPGRCNRHGAPGRHGKPENCEICGHLQLGIYQTMLATPAEDKIVARHGEPVENELTGEVLGASLLQVGLDPSQIERIEYRQEPITEVPRQDDWPDGVEHWPQLALREAAEVVSGASFRAMHTPGQQQCRVGVLCPLCDAGAEVTQPVD